MSSRSPSGKHFSASKGTESPSSGKVTRRTTPKKRAADDDDEFESSQPVHKKRPPVDSQDSSMTTTQASITSSMMSPPKKGAKSAKKSSSEPVVIDLDLDSPMDVSAADDWVRSAENSSISDLSTSFYAPSQKEPSKKPGLSQFLTGGLKPTSRAVSSLFSSQTGTSSRMDVQSTPMSHNESETIRSTIAKPPSIKLSSYLASSPSSTTYKSLKSSNIEPSLPWCDKYEPKTHDQLAIHRNKLNALVELLSSMLQTSRLNQSHQYAHIIPGTRVLILTGPTGTGKSTAIRLLLGKCLINEILPLEHFDVELVEYHTPVEYSNRTLEEVETDMAKETGHTPSNANWSSTYQSKLKPFLQQLQSQKYPSLPIAGVDEMLSEIKLAEPISSTALAPSKAQIKVLLVDDMPYLHDWKQKTEFQRTIKAILNSRDYNPIVFILSHAQAADTSTPWQLFSREILEHSSVKLLEFNAVNARLIQRTLNGILKQENISLAKEDVASLVETCGGDIRSAINSLQWMVEQKRFSIHTKRAKSVIVKANFPQTEIMKKSSTAKASASGAYTRVKVFSSLSRDIAPSLFHSLGKVLYAKRLKNGDINDVGNEVHELREHPTIPHTSLLYRSPMKASPEFIHTSNVEASGSLLMHYLLENYIKFFGTIEDVISASDYLAYADTYSSGPFRESSVIREYSDLVAMRGIMFSNANAKEWGFTKLVKPHSLQSQRTIRDHQELLDLIFDAPHLDFDVRPAPQRAQQRFDQEFEILGRGELPSHHPSFLGRKTIACDILPYQGLLMREASKNRQHNSRYASLILPAERAFVEQMVRFPPTAYNTGGGLSSGFGGHGKQSSVLGEQGTVTDADDYESEVKDRDRKHIIIANIMKERRTPLQLGGGYGLFNSSSSKAYSAYTHSSHRQTTSQSTPTTSIIGRGPTNTRNSSFLPTPTTFALPTALPPSPSSPFVDDIIDDDTWDIRKRG